MTLAQLLEWLTHANPNVRRQTALVFGMVYENDAVSALKIAYGIEVDESTKQIFSQALNRIENSSVETILNRVFEHFQINQEIMNLPEDMDFNEVELIDKMERQFRDDLSKRVTEQSQKIHLSGSKTGNIGSSQITALNASNSLLDAQNNFIKNDVFHP